MTKTKVYAINVPPWRATRRPDKYFYVRSRRLGVCLLIRYYRRRPHA